MTIARIAIAAACGVAACTSPPRARDCDPPPPTGTTLEAARETYRRANLRQLLRAREAVEPGYTTRLTDAMTSQLDGACVVDLAEAGRLLFERRLAAVDGLVAPLQRVQRGRAGGPDTTSCTSCHWRGGPAGAGGLPDDSYLLGDGDRTSSADARNPPALAGAGAVQALSDEMTAELAEQRAHALAEARRTGHAIEVALAAKGVAFGTLHASPSGRVDTRDVRGIDVDLVVRPFGWKGTAATLVEQLAESNALHFGIATASASAAHDPLAPLAPPAMSEGQLAALAVYVATLDTPISRPDEVPEPFQPAVWAHGRVLFSDLGCASCHVPALVLRSPIATIRTAAGEVDVDLSRDASAPRLARDPATGGYPVELYSDLKRHDLGDANAATHHHAGIGTRMYLTRRLWDLGDTGPYFHDGESASIDAAIARHGGEAQTARDAWTALRDPERDALRVFLTALRRAPQLQVP